jgi:hypothetical protein
MPKHWVRIAYSENPHPVDPCDAYRSVFQAVSGQGGMLDEMLFDEVNGYQYLLVSTHTRESFRGITEALRPHDAKPMNENLMALGELRSNGGSSAA